MTYLHKAKDSELTMKRTDLMKRFVSLNHQFNSLWIEQDETIAPYNEAMVKDYKSETLLKYLIDFRGLLADFKEQGIVLDLVERYETLFTSDVYLTEWMDIGFIPLIREFFYQAENRISSVKRQVRQIIQALDKCLQTTEPNFKFDDMNLTKHSKRCLDKGVTALIPTTNNDWFGTLPTVNTWDLHDADLNTLKTTLEPIYNEYKTLHDYLKLLKDTIKEARIEHEEDILTNPQKLSKLDTRIHFLQNEWHKKLKHTKTESIKFSEFQRMVVFEYYLNNKKANLTRQGLADNKYVRNLFIRYDSLKYLLYRELGASLHSNLLNATLYRAKDGIESLTELEQEVYSIHLTTKALIETQSETQTFGVLEKNHLTILAIISELHRTVAEMVYHNPSLTGFYLGLQGIMANFFVQLNPNNRTKLANLEKFPFKIKDGIIEGYLRKYNLDLPTEEPTVTTLTSLLFKRDRLLIEMDTIAVKVVRTLDKALEREEEGEVLKTTIKDAQNESEKKRYLLKVLK